MREKWALSQSSFDEFLAVLDPDRERAGRRYEELRTRIVKFFEWRAARLADDLADETLDRVARRLAAGELIHDPFKYSYGVARLVYLEAAKRQVKEQAIVVEMPYRPREDDDDERMTCLERCLGELTDNSRMMILSYYRADKQARIDHRKMLAEQMKISVNALRVKALRIRAVLEDCVMKCLGAGRE